MAPSDSFTELARYYDPIMNHVDYDRWAATTIALSELVPPSFLHLDLACGTCTLLHKLAALGWNSMGMDLSESMLRAGRDSRSHTLRGQDRVAVADLRALPLRDSVDLITCLFDSVNFLLDNESLNTAIWQMGNALKPNGILYFDIVTERMVTDHFAGQQWSERHGRLTTKWNSEFCHSSSIAETRIQINRGPAATLQERIYEQAVVEAAIKHAGLEILDASDAETWRVPRAKTLRIDFVAVKGDARQVRKRFKAVQERVRASLAQS